MQRDLYYQGDETDSEPDGFLVDGIMPHAEAEYDDDDADYVTELPSGSDDERHSGNEHCKNIPITYSGGHPPLQELARRQSPLHPYISNQNGNSIGSNNLGAGLGLGLGTTPGPVVGLLKKDENLPLPSGTAIPDCNSNRLCDSIWRMLFWCMLNLYKLFRNIVFGVKDIAFVIIVALRALLTFRVIPPMEMFGKNRNSTTATGGPILYSLFTQSWILSGMIYLVIAVGTEGILAETVEIRYLIASIPALCSVPLGLYIFAWGGLIAKTNKAYNVITLYTGIETLKLTGDVANLFRYIHLIHGRDHWTVLLTNKVPEWIEKRLDAADLADVEKEFRHGDCGEPHAILLLLLVSFTITMFLSVMNLSTIIWKFAATDHDSHKKSTSDAEDCDDNDTKKTGNNSPDRSRVPNRNRLPRTVVDARRTSPDPNHLTMQHYRPVTLENDRSRIVGMLMND